MILHADCFPAMLSFFQKGERFRLIYLDPPFFTQKDWFTKDGQLAYSDCWEDLTHYLDTLRGQLSIARELLEPNGSLVLHVDPRQSHRCRILLDEVFGPECFASEIIWRYRRWPVRSLNFQKVHDVLIRYVLDPKAKPCWNQQYEPLSPSTLKVWGDKRKQKARFDDGKRIKSVLTEEPSLGALMGDVWELSIIAPNTAERTGYPTQKPEALLERLIIGLTNVGDRVLDPMCGSGTTVAVANRLGRVGVGIDSSSLAVTVARTRCGYLQST